MANNYNHYKRKAFLGFKENQRYSLDKIGFKYLQSIELVLNKNCYI